MARSLAKLGYEKVSLVESEGQWSQRGDIVDVFPVAAELPVRLELFGDELELIREFDPTTQRSLDRIERLVLTPTSFSPIIAAAIRAGNVDDLNPYLSPEAQEQFAENESLEGMRRFLGVAFEQPASLLDYLPENTLIAVDEPAVCQPHSERWYEHVAEHWSEFDPAYPPIHQHFEQCRAQLDRFEQVHLSEIAETDSGMNLASRPVGAIPHQFGKLAQQVRDERDRGFTVWIISAQPSRSVALLQEHDCPAQFIPNPRDYLAIEKLQSQRTPVALKYSGLAEIEGFILPTFRLLVISDREFFGQHTLATPTYIRKRRRAASKQVDPNKLNPGDYVVHKSHGIGKFIKLESLTLNAQTREYLVLQYADGTLRIAADQLGCIVALSGRWGRRRRS